MTTIADNLNAIRERIATAANGAGRDPDAITLVAVSKFQPADAIRTAYAAGQRCFGENYAQHLRDKAAELADLDIAWHFIGHLQKNKAKYVAPVAALMETVDSPELADALAARAERPLSVLIEVNIGDEASKSGVDSEELLPLARHILQTEQLKLQGLMVIPPYDSDPEHSRPFFRRLRAERDRLNDALALDQPLTHLSMGMSHDFAVAIEEGATIVRVGTAIFGERPSS